MKSLVYLTGFILVLFIYGFYLSQNEISVTNSNLKKESFAPYYDYRGVGNIQTNISKGSSSPVEVISEARRASLDFIILTDINKFTASENQSGYHGNLLVFDAGEYTYLDSRLQFLSLEKERGPENLQEAHLYFTDLLSQKNQDSTSRLLILAHPFTNGALNWNGEFPTGLRGLEIFSPKSIAEKAWKKSKINVLWSLFVYPFNPQYAFLRLFQESNDELSLWDQLNKNRAIIGFAGADANARAIPYANYLIKFPSYQRSLEIASNHVLLESELTGNFQNDRAKLFSALTHGHFYMAIDLLGDTKGFSATVVDREKNYPMGSQIHFTKNLHLNLSLPTQPKYNFETLIFKNGERIHSSDRVNFQYEISSPGTYRVVVRVLVKFPLPDGKKWVSWIYSNPFFIN